MLNFYKNKLINSILEEYYSTFAKTLDTNDFVPEKYTKKIHRFIFKNMQKKFKEVDKEFKLHNKSIKQKEKIKAKKQKEESKKNDRSDTAIKREQKEKTVASQ